MRQANKLSTIYQMRQAGLSLSQIASQQGISRERVRQLLMKYRGSSEIAGLLSTHEVAISASCPSSYIKKLRRRGLIRPARIIGKARALWEPETVDILARFVAGRRCRVCREPLPVHRWSYCSDTCRLESHRYRNWPKQAKKRHNERGAQWQKDHPEQAREIKRAAQAKHHAGKASERYSHNQYVVWKKCSIPMGTAVEVLGYMPSVHRLAVMWQGHIIEVPTGCVRRVPKR